MKRSKRYQTNRTTIDRSKEYTLEEAVDLLKKAANAKFDEVVECAIRLGVDPKKADQVVRGTVTLPAGTGRKVRVLALTKTKQTEAEEAGADYVGSDDYIEKIKEGWLDVDVIVATPEVMAQVGKLGKILGARGLMPNPKSGTVTQNVAQTVREIKAGRVEFRVDKAGIIHLGLGKVSFTHDQIKQNIEEFLRMVVRLRPATAKGQYIRSIYLSSTMGPGIRLSPSVAEFN
ncbi:MAG: 50S ribosomal protein L1 [Calditrichaeota bacterium]|nr:50S ribosomal protein L1 [Calditrichota bacterium]